MYRRYGLITRRKKRRKSEGIRKSWTLIGIRWGPHGITRALSLSPRPSALPISPSVSPSYSSAPPAIPFFAPVPPSSSLDLLAIPSPRPFPLRYPVTSCAVFFPSCSSISLPALPSPPLAPFSSPSTPAANIRVSKTFHTRWQTPEERRLHVFIGDRQAVSFSSMTLSKSFDRFSETLGLYRHRLSERVWLWNVSPGSSCVWPLLWNSLAVQSGIVYLFWSFTKTVLCFYVKRITTFFFREVVCLPFSTRTLSRSS